MIRYATATFVLTIFLGSAAFGHTRLESSSPAEGESAAVPIEEIVLVFEHEVRLTAVTLRDAAGAAKALGAVPVEIAAELVIDVREPLAPGEHVIGWRAVGADTHIVSGEIRFQVVAPAHAH